MSEEDKERKWMLSIINGEQLLSSPLLPIIVIIVLWIWIYLPFLLSLPAGVDFAAHLFRLFFFSENGLNSEWNGLWYTGTAFLELYPPNTTFFLWFLDIFFPINQSYVIFMVGTHLLISLATYFALKKIGRSKSSSLFAALFIMTLPNLNTNFMFFSRAPTHIGFALLLLTLGLYYSEKRYTSVAVACLLSMTHFMMFGFLIVIILTSELSHLGFQIKNLYSKHNGSFKSDIKPLVKNFFLHTIIWLIPFVWVAFFMTKFFLEPIGLLMITPHSFSSFTDGPGIVYQTLRVVRDFLYTYITTFVFMFLIIFAFSLISSRINWKELGLLVSMVLITFVGFLMFYSETSSYLPLIFRGMDVLRFVLMSQVLIVLIAIRGVNHWSSKILLVLILLLPVAEAQNGVTNYGYLEFDDNQWRDLTPIANDLNKREGFFYVCPYNYQGDHMAYLPALTGKPYFDGWNPPGVRLNWFQETPPSSGKYRPNSSLIGDIANNPAKYGVKWFITRRDFYGLSGSWSLVSQEQDQNKWLWETNSNVSLVEVSPSGTGSLEYTSPNTLKITINSDNTTVDLLIRVAHHPSWNIQTNNNLSIVREEEIGFMEVKGVSSDSLILKFESNQVDVVFIGFILNLIIIAVLSLWEYEVWELMRRKKHSRTEKINVGV